MDACHLRFEGQTLGATERGARIVDVGSRLECRGRVWVCTVIIDDKVLEECQRIVGHRFGDLKLLVTALTHASIAESRLASNERMEFLGDAVLGMIVCDYLFHTYPELLEGDLTKIKSAAVSRRMCSLIATELGLDRLLSLGKGMKSRSALPSSLSAAVLESVIGAIYLDAGMQRVREFLLPHLVEHISAAAASGHQQNFKSVLQQHAQQKLSAQPVYVLQDENGPDHAKAFFVAVEIGSRRFTACWANSKKQAEQLAALSALEELGLIVRDESGAAVVVDQNENAASGGEAARMTDEHLENGDGGAVSSAA